MTRSARTLGLGLVLRLPGAHERCLALQARFQLAELHSDQLGQPGRLEGFAPGVVGLPDLLHRAIIERISITQPMALPGPIADWAATWATPRKS